MSFSLPRFSQLLLLTTALTPISAFGQGAVQQSGVVTTAHFACWLANGIVNDCGISSLNPVTLPAIANGHVIGNASGTVQAAADYSLTAMLDTLATPAQGDVLYRNGSVWTYLHAGTSGQFLQTLGAGANPAWATPTPVSYAGSASILLTGTVFSISPPVTVPNGGTGLISGTSGGIPAFTNASTIESSGVLAQHAVVLGGGAGAVPYSAPAGLGTSGQVLTSNGAAADPSWTNAAGGTVTSINTGHALTGGPITASGTIEAVDATSGVAGVVTPDTNALHFLSGAGTWDAPLAAGTGISFTSGTVALTSPTLTGTTGSIGGSSLAAGGCTLGTVAIVGATTSMAVAFDTVTYPGDASYQKAYVSSAGTVTAANCMVTAGTPTATVFNIRVIQ